MSSINLVNDDRSLCSDHFAQGMEYFEDRSIPRAAESFKMAYESVLQADTYRNKYASYSGLTRVLSGDLGGIELCREAARSERKDGDVFLNLARAEWYYGNRKRTIVALKRGLCLDVHHLGLRQMRLALGVRRRSPLPFLPRSHKLNQALGQLMRKIDK